MIYVLLAILGLCSGSFINALVWRIHKQENSKDKKYSIIKGKSICPNCEHKLQIIDLIPVFSWISLKGKCRYCKKPISWQYPAVEITTALLFVLSYWSWPYLPLSTSYLLLMFVTWLIVLVGLIALTVYDIKWMELPDKIVYPLILLVISSLIVQFILGRPISDALGISLSAVIGGGIFWILYQVSGGKWIGGGDVKLGFLLGLIVAKPEYAFMFLFLASIIGTLFIAPLLVTKKLKRTSKVPFGPFLIISASIVTLYGSQILDWYENLLM
jgi:prepilin signal peptidase PulO-like enzyme (type II secretory pathway)